MSVKKNLTIATLAALLAVPAFNGTNISNLIHNPSITAHAASVHSPNLFGAPVTSRDIKAGHTVYGSPIKTTTAGTKISGPDGNHYVSAGTPIAVQGKNSNGQYLISIPKITGNYITSSDPFTQSAQSNYGNHSNFSNQVNSDSNSQTNNNTTQYTSKSELPQTGESNGASKAMAMGAVALGASASMMALSMAKKHRQESELDSISSEPTVDDGDGKLNDDNADNIDTGYHMIMSNTFANISKDLKQM